jgi:hypothetical protein
LTDPPLGGPLLSALNAPHNHNCNGTDLLNKYGVDLYIGAHEHSYERNYAIYRGQVMSKDYVNPGAPAYVVAGAAGVRTLSLSLCVCECVCAAFTSASPTPTCVTHTVHRRAGPVAVGAHAPVDRRPLQ